VSTGVVLASARNAMIASFATSLRISSSRPRHVLGSGHAVPTDHPEPRDSMIATE
jgi:hypothetical protein